MSPGTLSGLARFLGHCGAGSEIQSLRDSRQRLLPALALNTSWPAAQSRQRPSGRGGGEVARTSVDSRACSLHARAERRPATSSRSQAKRAKSAKSAISQRFGLSARLDSEQCQLSASQRGGPGPSSSGLGFQALPPCQADFLTATSLEDHALSQGPPFPQPCGKLS